MPKIGNFTPNEPFNSVIQSSPDAVNAPGLPDTGLNVAEGAIRSGTQLSNDVAETGALVRNAWLRPIGEGLAGVVAGVSGAVKAHRDATNKMNALYNTNTAGASADDLITHTNTQASDYIEANKNDPNAFSPEAIAKFSAGYKTAAGVYRDQLTGQLQPTTDGAQGAYNGFDAAVRKNLVEINKRFDTAKGNAMTNAVGIRDTNLDKSLATQSTTDLAGALARADSPETAAIKTPAGTMGKIPELKDNLKISNWSTQKTFVLNANNFIPKDGNLYVGAKAQLEAAKLLNKQLTNPNSLLVKDTDPKILLGMQSQAAETEKTMTDNLKLAKENNDLHYWDTARTASDQAINGATPEIRQEGKDDFTAIQANYEKLPFEDRAKDISSAISSFGKEITHDQENRGRTVQETSIYNATQVEKIQKEDQAERPQTPENKAKYNTLEKGFSDVAFSVDGVAKLPENKGSSFVIGSGITAGKLYKMGTALEEAKHSGAITEPQYKELSKLYTKIRHQVTPAYKQEAPQLPKGQHPESLDVVKTEAMPSEFASYMELTPGSIGYQNAKTYINNQLDRLHTDSKLQEFNLTPRQWKNTVLNGMMENRYKVKPLLAPERVRSTLKVKNPDVRSN